MGTQSGSWALRGSSRLLDAVPTVESPAAGPTPPEKSAADPPEVDISQHYYAPQRTLQTGPAGTTTARDGPSMSEAQLRQLMLGSEGPNPLAPGNSAEDDQMMKLLSQMLGGGGGGGGPGGNNMPFGPFAPAPQTTAPDRYAALWRLVHFAVALALSLYIAVFTPFSGSEREREQSVLEHKLGHVTEQDVFKRYFFYAFATAETVLLTSRPLPRPGKGAA